MVGNDKVIEVANRLGVDTTDMQPVLSLPLGSKEITPIQMAGAYAAFANDGIYNRPWFIERVEDRDGHVIYEHRPNGERAVSSQTARMIAEVLEGNVLQLGGTGTGKRARIEGQHAAGKTGTTQNNMDAWFVGFTGYYTTATWLGDPNAKVRIEFPDHTRFYYPDLQVVCQPNAGSDHFQDRPVVVAGSVGPTGELFQPLGPLEHEEAMAVFVEQIEGLKPDDLAPAGQLAAEARAWFASNYFLDRGAGYLVDQLLTFRG